MQVRDDFIRIAFSLSIWRENEQGHFTLLECRPAMMPVAINAMVTCDQYCVPAFPPLDAERSQEYILLDRLAAILDRIGTVGFACIIHHHRMKQ